MVGVVFAGVPLKRTRPHRHGGRTETARVEEERRMKMKNGMSFKFKCV